jgi:uncharacterized membrane protein YbaN (DUF454 family)
MKIILICLGFFFTFLGFLGAILPLLPTTPFILLAVLCFAKSSPKFHNWLVGTKIYQEYVHNFKKYRGYTFKQKIKMLISLYIVVGFSIIMVDIIFIRIGLGSDVSNTNTRLIFSCKNIAGKLRIKVEVTIVTSTF